MMDEYQIRRSNMTKWTKRAAQTELKKLISEIEGLTQARRHSAEHVRWIANTLRFLEQVFGRGSRYFLTFGNLKWEETSSFILHGWDYEKQIERRHQDAYLHDIDSAKGLLEAALDELNSSDIDDVYDGKDTAPESSAIVKIINIIENKLRKVIRETPNGERSVQDAVENLLIGADVDYSREKDSIEYSSKHYIPDFTMKRIDLAVEVKFCDKAKKEKDIIAEINDDILAYKTKYGNVVFVVYDVGIIRDVERFSKNFEDQDGVIVRVVKH